MEHHPPPCAPRVAPASPERPELAPDITTDSTPPNSPASDAASLPRTPPAPNVTFASDPDKRPLLDYSPPKSPFMSPTDSMMNLSPYSSTNDDYVIYSDSDGASQSSLDIKHLPPNIDSKLEHERQRARARATAKNDETPTPKPKKRIRRKSTKSETSDKSHRSSLRHHGSEYHMGTGYTSMPAAGKIFRNLLILEESLREQVIQQRAMRRKYLTFLAVLCSLMASIAHHLFFSDPEYTSSGPTRVVLQFTLLALLVTLMLYHLSGEYQKTIVLPRKFLSSTNKGLRQLNVRLVKIKTSFTDNVIDLIREFVLFITTMCLSCLHKVYPSTINNRSSRLEVFLVSCKLQCQPRVGVTDVKLVLNARVFSTDVREGWELYRSEFWIHEGVRRRNQMMAFTGMPASPPVQDRSKLLKKDKKERRDRRKSTANSDILTPTPNRLSELNLRKLASGFDIKTTDSTRSNTPYD